MALRAGTRGRSSSPHGVSRMLRFVLLHLLTIVCFVCACGARTGFQPLSDGNALEIDGAPAPPSVCPPCPSNFTCSGQLWACIESDGCTYGYCDFTGPERIHDLCGRTPWLSGWCVGQSPFRDTTEISAGPCYTRTAFIGTSLCTFSSDGGANCIQGDGSQQSKALKPNCGTIACGTGCTCVCENFCWCGENP
jgi:hypothetical protein